MTALSKSVDGMAGGGGGAQPVGAAQTNARLATVIGSGFGGLAAAIRLACKGWRVQVLSWMPRVAVPTCGAKMASPSMPTIASPPPSCWTTRGLAASALPTMWSCA